MIPATRTAPVRILARTRRATAAGAAVVAALGLPIAGAPAQTSGESIVPRPARALADSTGAPFELRSPVHIVVASGGVRLREIGELLGTVIRERTGFVVRVSAGDVSQAPEGAITLDTVRFAPRLAPPTGGGAEAYTLDVSRRSVAIRGATSAAVLWGVQSFRQLLPPDFERRGGARRAAWRVVPVRVDDAPRFSWRGSMVDVGRHFFPVRDIKRHIDLLSRYKLNIFHWHLTDDQGWRLEIRRFPALARVGGRRTEATGDRYAGFYTQAEAREVVEYARQRGVTVVPEIEMPGHSSAALAAYPQLGCTGETIAVPNSWGVFADIFCAGKDEVFTTLFGVLDEVMDIFPSPYVHIGGDEVPKDRWRACAACQAVMRREGLANEEELQGWFLRRIAAHVSSRGRTIIGWDEVLEGRFAPGAIVQSWRDSSFTRKAAERGHRVIASPNEWVYLNRQAGELTLEQVYAFDPVPKGLAAGEQHRVLGSEVTFWSEHITSGTNLALMALPRLLAFADVVWGAAPRDLTALQLRIDGDHRARLGGMEFVMGPGARALPRIVITFDSVTRQARWQLTDTLAGLGVHATFDGSPPRPTSRALAPGAGLGKGGMVRLQAFVAGERVLEERHLTIRQHAGVGARARITPAPSTSYPGTGPFTLTDGLIGSPAHGDGLWTGWWGPDVEIVVDLGQLQPIAHVSANFLQNVRSWIVLPAQVGVSWSNDGERWSEPRLQGHDVPIARDGAIVHPFALALPAGTSARFVRLTARNAGRLPPGHPGAGEASWLFADEIVITPRAAARTR
ncbi:MAG: beta-N-acetylhexosaminidase [Gemmatimonadetes bacterium]|nr:beta-N-acetylhexosaminidase [Gemmatimonadota bacterium]